MRLLFLVKIIFLSLNNAHAQSIIKKYSTKNCDFVLIIKPNGKYELTRNVEISKDIIQTESLTIGNWITNNSTLILNDSVRTNEVSNPKSYKLHLVGEYNLVNISAPCFQIGDTLSIVGLRDIEHNWTFIGELSKGEMTGIKFDLENEIIYQLEEGEVISQDDNN